MRILLCIDDTDNIDSRGTGDLAEDIARAIEEKGWGTSFGVTRHQLLVHPDIPYTSHNSCMCFTAEINGNNLPDLIVFAAEFLRRESAEGSDPGLCIAVPDWIPNHQVITEFGRKAKKTVVTKEEAYGLAGTLGIHLSEHGGTGQGVIGALAGIGLRLSGSDGRFKGKFKIEAENGFTRVSDIILSTKVDVVQSLNGEILGTGELIKVSDEVKTVFLDHQSVLLVYPYVSESFCTAKWQVCSKQQLKRY